jgi:hypothetical protein
MDLNGPAADSLADLEGWISKDGISKDGQD